MKFAQVIIGAGFGDEGKAVMTDYFTHKLINQNPIVIRYNGGSQASHTVKTPDGIKHVFRHFGSGTLQSVPTYLTKEFIVNPIFFNEEFDTLSSYNSGRLCILASMHPDCRVTTPYDILLNHIVESHRHNKHGTCGIGIFETIKRHEKIPLRVADLSLYTKREKLVKLFDTIKQYVISRIEEYNITITNEQSELLELNVVDAFLNDIRLFLNRTSIRSYESLKEYDTYIFESAQGLLLSEKYGTMPHCTPSDPGLGTPLELCTFLNVKSINVCYVTRCYATRHGNGPLPNEQSPESLNLVITDETNVDNEHQGAFRYAKLDLPTIAYAINDDFSQSSSYKGIVTQQLAITCIDQLISYNYCNHINYHYMNRIRAALKINDGYFSLGQTRNDVYKSTTII